MNAVHEMRYEDITQELEQLRARCRALELSARKSAEQLEEAKAALRFYADYQKYEIRYYDDLDSWRVPIDLDRGEIARRVLGGKK